MKEGGRKEGDCGVTNVEEGMMERDEVARWREQRWEWSMK
jgi:hypothetical protein